MSTIYLGTAASVTGTNFDLSGCTVTLTTQPSLDTHVVNKKYIDDAVVPPSMRIDDILVEAGNYQTIKSVVDLINIKDTDLLKKIDMLFLQFFHKTSKNADISNNVINYNKILLQNISTYSLVNGIGEWDITTDIIIEAGQTLIIPENAKINNTKTLSNSGTIIFNKNTFNNIGGTFNNNGGTINYNNGGRFNNDNGGTFNNDNGGTFNINQNSYFINVGGIINNIDGIINNGFDCNFYNNSAGTINISSSGIFNNISGSFNNTPNGIVNNNGVFNSDSRSAINNYDNAIFNNVGTLNNAGSFTNRWGTINNNFSNSIIQNDTTGVITIWYNSTFNNKDYALNNDGNFVSHSSNPIITTIITGNQPRVYHW